MSPVHYHVWVGAMLNTPPWPDVQSTIEGHRLPPQTRSQTPSQKNVWCADLILAAAEIQLYAHRELVGSRRPTLQNDPKVKLGAMRIRTS
mgnify:CR=1 FL=1